MSAIEITALLIVAIIASVIIGIFIGRRMNVDNQEALRQLNTEHEKQLLEKQTELDVYRDKVHAHFDKTAGLFVNMAGSYKDLFDHLSAGYDQLGELGMDKKLPERAGALLDGPEANEQQVEADSFTPDYSKITATAGNKDL
ncbi:ZapG family protein [Methylophaga sp. OBS3]|uniref:ZapG family protein n=1 Tax=Methylophaga sp. OBS3 TaxID=2991934 RepID=UPI00225325B2|nr:DUF1043 family protein [Methylophaga sp. OBS3]MCX4188812.1 YhcB family protein [Methylophaga sp. OBS3]